MRKVMATMAIGGNRDPGGAAMARLWRRLGLVLCCLCLTSPALADMTAEGEFGSVALSGFARAQVDIHTAQRNPNNLNQKGNPTLQLFRQWILADTSWQTPLKGFRLFARTRIWSDTTANVDPNIRHYDAFPTHYPGDGAFGMVSNDQVAAQLWEAWGQYDSESWFVRVGKQTIVWGDVAPTRLLDDINPLDLSWHLEGEPLGKEVFDNLRIPIWAARAAYTLPFAPAFQIEGYVSPDAFSFVDTQLPDRNAPFNVVPRISSTILCGTPSSPTCGTSPFFPLVLRFRDNMRDGRVGASGGVRLAGTLYGVNFSLDWFERHDADPLTKFQGFTPTFFPPAFTPYFHLGIVDLKQQHPRFDTAGFSLNYFEQVTGTVWRVEGGWDIARPWESPLTNFSKIIRRDQYGYAIAIDRPTFFVANQHKATSLTLQFEERVRDGGHNNIGIGADTVDRHGEIVTVLIEQPFQGFGGRYVEWYVDLATLAAVQDAWIFVPMLRYEPGDHWRYAVWYNLFHGPYSKPQFNATPGGFGGIAWASGVNLSVSYQF